MKSEIFDVNVGCIRHICFRVLFLFCFPLLIGLESRIAWAVPGPDSVVVVANKNVAESIVLAKTYAIARAIPDNQVCLLDLPNQPDISMNDYNQRFLGPFEACLKKGGVTSRIEAVLLMRGVPLRVSVLGGRGSLAAVLGMWKSTDKDGNAVVGLPIGFRTKFLQAAWRNAFRSGVFRPGWSNRAYYNYKDAAGAVRTGQFVSRPLLVTMFHGRNYKDAGLLLQSALDAEKSSAAKGQFVLMKGRDKARSVLDREFTSLLAELKKRGFTNATEEKFQTDMVGRKLAAMIIGTSSLGKSIEGNTYLPGSLVDNLTSYGAVPKNFEATGETQVSIARWVAKGVAGAHGTTDEPLNNCFPSRFFLIDYVDGSTLAEAYFRRMPFVYWRNLVLGDPMAAPYALRPKVSVQGVKAGDLVAGARQLKISAIDPGKRGMPSITVLLNGKIVAKGKGMFEPCILFPNKNAKNVQLLIVAQALLPTGGNRRKFMPKGWFSMRVETQSGGPQTCVRSEPVFEPLSEPFHSNEGLHSEPIRENVSEKPPEPKLEPASEPLSDAALTNEPLGDSSTREETASSEYTALEPHSLPDGGLVERVKQVGCGCDAPSTTANLGLWFGLLFCFFVWEKKKGAV